MKYRIWLDDDMIYRPMPERYNVRFQNAIECIEFINKNLNDIEMISFDNDLGPPENGEGTDVARHIEMLAYIKKIKRIHWSVHSANNVAEKNIIATMKSAERFWNEQEGCVVKE